MHQSGGNHATLRVQRHTVFDVPRDFATDVHAVPSYERCLSKSLLPFTNHTKDPIMPDKSAKGIDRRNLIVASIATVGSAAAVARQR